MVLHALSTSEHHVVVRHNQGAAALFVKQLTVDLTQTRHHAVAGSIFNQVFN